MKRYIRANSGFDNYTADQWIDFIAKNIYGWSGPWMEPEGWESISKQIKTKTPDDYLMEETEEGLKELGAFDAFWNYMNVARPKKKKPTLQEFSFIVKRYDEDPWTEEISAYSQEEAQEKLNNDGTVEWWDYDTHENRVDNDIP